MKKTLAKILAVLCAIPVFALAGCSSDDNSSSTPADNSSSSVEDDSSESDESVDNSLELVISNGKLVVGLDPTFKPMGYTDENGDYIGFDIDCAKEVCKRLGVELELQGIVWTTKEQTLDAGLIDCIWNGLSWSEERDAAMNLSFAYLNNEMTFVVTSESTIAAIADLNGKKVAVQSGSTAQEILEAQKDELGITIEALETNVEAFQQLELNMVDAVFGDSVVAEFDITDAGKDFVLLEEGLSEETYVIGFRKNDEALKAAVENALIEMKNDGALAEISTKWFGSDITVIAE